MIKRLVRKFSLWLEWYTSTWVLPIQVWKDIEDDKPINLDKAEKHWGKDDPELLKAKARISQVTYFKKND